nr:hypothetical protein [Tanacetum cinerariifolium]
MDHNIYFSGSDHQTPQYPDVHENPLTNDEFEAFMKANDDKINNLETKFDYFQKQCEQMQDDLLNQIRNFIQNFQSGPPGEDKEHEATTNTELLSTEDIHPLAIQEPLRESDICQLIEECCVEVPKQQKQNMEKTMLDLEQEVKIVEEQPAERINHAENDDESFEDIEYIDASVPDPAIVSVEKENVVQREEEEKLLSITRLITNIESLNDNSTPDRVVNSFESDNSLLDNFSPEFETFCDHLEETRSGNTIHANYSLLEYDSFCFEIEPDQERLINLMKNDVPDNSSNDPLLEEADLFLSDDSIPPGIENVADDPEEDIRFLEELLISDSILSHESSDSNFKDNPSISRPPPEPPDDNFDLEPEVISAVMEDIYEHDEHFNPEREINVSTKIEDGDYFPFMFVIRFFLPYFIFPEVSPLLPFAESEDTIFDPGISD